MNSCPQTALATATARAQHLESITAGVLATVAATGLNHGFFAQRLAALSQVHRRQLFRLRALHFSPDYPC